MRIIGLDASTSTVGICILDYNEQSIKLVHYEYYKPDKSNGLLDMLQKTRAYILDLFYKYQVQEFVIEDFVKFMKGASSASTVIPLAILNMTLRLAMLDIGVIPESLNVLKIRHTIKRNKELPKKEDIPELVAYHLGIDYPWYYKINKRTKQQVVIEESFDVADAMAVSIAWVKLKIAPKKSRSIKVKDLNK
jgi:Holliday junction resolvasome RuvABC endonuclease subunit